MVAVQWVNVLSGLSSIATVAVATAAGIAAVLYGRRADVTVDAQAHRHGEKLFLAVRPSVRAVGLFRLKFDDQPENEPVIIVTEVLGGDELSDGLVWKTQTRPFGANLVEPGETLTTTVLFDVSPTGSVVIGWRIVLSVSVSRRWIWRGADSWFWDDRLFIPAPPGA